MKRVYIDGFSLVNKELFGIHRFTYEILKELDRLIHKGEVVLLIPEDGEKDFEFCNIEVRKLRRSNLLKNHKWLRAILWTRLGFVSYVRAHRGLAMDCLLSVSFLPSDIFFYYDCIKERVPQNADTRFQKIERICHIICTFMNVKFSKKVVTISNYSRKDIMDYYHIPSGKFAIVYTSWEHFNRVKADSGILEKYGLKKGEYCFSLGSRYYHKNFRWIAEAAIQNPQYVFVVSGSNLLSSSDSALDEKKPQNMIFTGYLSDGEIKALMQNCKVFIQPSLYEGAGMPPMEAMSTGARCIVANATSLPELYRDSVWYIDPKKYDAIEIDQIMKPEIEDNDQVLKRYSWKKSAERVYQVIRAVKSS